MLLLSIQNGIIDINMGRAKKIIPPTKDEILLKNPKVNRSVVEEYEAVDTKLKEVLASKKSSYQIASPFSGAVPTQPGIIQVAVPNKK